MVTHNHMGGHKTIGGAGVLSFCTVITNGEPNDETNGIRAATAGREVGWQGGDGAGRGRSAGRLFLDGNSKPAKTVNSRCKSFACSKTATSLTQKTSYLIFRRWMA